MTEDPWEGEVLGLSQRLVREVEAVLRLPNEGRQSILAERGANRNRVNPRTGQTSDGWLCHICLSRECMPPQNNATYLVCTECWKVDQLAANRVHLPYLLPIVTYTEALLPPASAYVDDPDDEGFYSRLAEVQADSDLVVDWRNRAVNWMSRRMGVHQWPDVPLSMWQANISQSASLSSECLVEYSNLHAEFLLEEDPLLGDVAFLSRATCKPGKQDICTNL